MTYDLQSISRPIFRDDALRKLYKDVKGLKRKQEEMSKDLATVQEGQKSMEKRMRSVERQARPYF